ncbi:serine-rich adhesin for platelets [Engraulis encrasicolus]|uniref:serine-rich adhesin for platelets n=1 Tax=Engraulis encrasicolus TaxID=184585 RepID=UPI002FD686C6
MPLLYQLIVLCWLLGKAFITVAQTSPDPSAVATSIGDGSPSDVTLTSAVATPSFEGSADSSGNHNSGDFSGSGESSGDVITTPTSSVSVPPQSTTLTSSAATESPYNTTHRCTTLTRATSQSVQEDDTTIAIGATEEGPTVPIELNDMPTAVMSSAAATTFGDLAGFSGSTLGQTDMTSEPTTSPTEATETPSSSTSEQSDMSFDPTTAPISELEGSTPTEVTDMSTAETLSSASAISDSVEGSGSTSAQADMISEPTATSVSKLEGSTPTEVTDVSTLETLPVTDMSSALTASSAPVSDSLVEFTGSTLAQTGMTSEPTTAMSELDGSTTTEISMPSETPLSASATVDIVDTTSEPTTSSMPEPEHSTATSLETSTAMTAAAASSSTTAGTTVDAEGSATMESSSTDTPTTVPDSLTELTTVPELDTTAAGATESAPETSYSITSSSTSTSMETGSTEWSTTTDGDQSDFTVTGGVTEVSETTMGTSSAAETTTLFPGTSVTSSASMATTTIQPTTESSTLPLTTPSTTTLEPTTDSSTTPSTATSRSSITEVSSAETTTTVTDTTGSETTESETTAVPSSEGTTIRSTESIGSVTTPTTTTVMPTSSTNGSIADPCSLCPPGSFCVNSTCQCLTGTYLVEGNPSVCMEARVFPGKLRVDRQFEPEMADQSSQKFKSIAKEIRQALKTALDKQAGYIESIVLSLRKGSVVAIVENIFNIESNATENGTTFAIHEAIDNCDNCGSILAKAMYWERPLCPSPSADPSIPSACDPETSVCSAQGGIVNCSCKAGYVNNIYHTKSCQACPSGQKAEGGICVWCPFGYGGFNCDDSSLLAVVVISCVLGGVLLILILALLLYHLIMCRKDRVKQPKTCRSPYSPDDFRSSWPTQGVMPLPRAIPETSPSPETSLEMMEGGSTHSLVSKRGTNGLIPLKKIGRKTGSYDVTPVDNLGTFKGQSASRYSYLVQGHENPYFLPGDDNRSTWDERTMMERAENNST